MTEPAEPTALTSVDLNGPALDRPVQLYLRAANAVARIDFADRRAEITELPILGSGEPITFLATATGAMVVPGYFVPDGGQPRELSLGLDGWPVLPGPDGESVWVGERGGPAGVRLVHAATGAVADRVLTVPKEAGELMNVPEPDGSGYALITDARGVFDVRPDGAHRIFPTSELTVILARGADRLVPLNCTRPDQLSCPASLVRLPDGRELRRFGALPRSFVFSPGAVAQDTKSALVYQPSGPGQVAARLLDLRTGRFVGEPVAVDPGVQDGAVAFSADGRWGFVIGTGGQVIVVDARTGAQHPIGADLPVAYQLSVKR